MELNDPYARILALSLTALFTLAVFLIIGLPASYQETFTPLTTITVTENGSSDSVSYISDEYKFDPYTSTITFKDQSGAEHTFSFKTHQITLSAESEQQSDQISRKEKYEAISADFNEKYNDRDLDAYTLMPMHP